MKNKFLYLILLAIPICILSGCSSMKRETVAESETEVVTEKDSQVVFSIKDLDDGGYYVRHVDSGKGLEKYSRLYVNQASFDTAEINNMVTDTNVLWFTEDEMEKIPTMYSNDTLVFHSDIEFDDTFTVERFEDLGYTAGICALEKTTTGRYEVSTDRAESSSIDPLSDANKLYDFGAHTVVIDQMGNAALRSGNVSRAGTIMGLEKDKNYKAEVYLGTNLTEITLKADVTAMASMEILKTTNFQYLKSTIIQINFPEYYNTGYYLINGYGVVRYVKGTDYNEETNFNVPNIVEKEEEQTEDDVEKTIQDDDVLDYIGDGNEVTGTINTEGGSQQGADTASGEENAQTDAPAQESPESLESVEAGPVEAVQDAPAEQPPAEQPEQ